MMRITVAALETSGAVQGTPDPRDGRQTLITLTARFRKTVKASRAAKEDWLFRALPAQRTPREHEQLAATVNLLQRLAEF